MRLTKHYLYAAFTTAGLIGAGALGYSSQVYGASNIKPYTITTVDFVMKGGSVTQTEKTTTYRRNDGATVIVKNRLNDRDLGINMRQVDLPDGRSILISDDAKMKSTLVTANSAASKTKTLGLNPQTCSSPAGTLIGEGELAGQRSVTVTLPLIRKEGGVARVKETLLPEFDCATANLEIQNQQENGDWITVRGIKFMSLIVGDPTPSMFGGFENYQEARPSDLNAAQFKAHGITADQCPACFQANEATEAYYTKHQQSR